MYCNKNTYAHIIFQLPKMSEVKIISNCLVQAATPPPMADHENHRIDLTPWDLQLLLFDPMQKGILIRKPTPQQQRELLGEYSTVDFLKLSLSKTLDHFPPLAGRLISEKNDDEDDTVSLYIDCNNLGAQFTHAVADDVTTADIIKPTYVPAIVHSLFSLNGVPNWEGISKPLLAVQMTELADGIFIGCTVNHCVGDGTSFWSFFYSWCQIGTGSEDISVPVVIKPWVPDGAKFPIRIHSWNQLILEKFIPPIFKERIFRFSKEGVAHLKAKANSLANNNGIENNIISSFQALLAYLWLTITSHRHSNFQNNYYDDDEEVTLLLLIDARDRLKPPLPKGYFGNAVYTRAIRCTAKDLLKNDVGWAAKLINEHVTLQTSDEVKKWYVDWTKNPKILKKREALRNTLVVSGSPRFNIYGNDIKPVAVRSGMGNKYDGKLTVYSGSKDGEVDVEVCLSPETMHALETDQGILEATAVKSSARRE